MAASPRGRKRTGKAKKLKFEISRNGIAGIGVVVFCLFLWTFLLGVWAGQTLLSSGGNSAITASEEGGSGPKLIQAENMKIKR